MTWRDYAACLGMVERGSDPWFPHTAFGRSRAKGYKTAAIRHAQEICAECPVRGQCLALAMKREEGLKLDGRYGVFGGLTPEQRYALERASKVA